MSLSAEIVNAVRNNVPLDTLDIPEDKRADAIKYAEMQLDTIERESGQSEATKAYRLRLASDQPTLDAQTAEGAEARRDVPRAEDALLDIQHLMKDMPEGASIRPAPEMGYATGNVLAKYETDRDVAHFLGDIIPKGSKPVKLTTRGGEPVWGYIKPGESDVYRLTPSSLIEDIPSTLGSMTSHPAELLAGVGAAFTPGGWLKKLGVEVMASSAGRAFDEYRERQAGATEPVMEDVKDVAGTAALTAVTSGVFSLGEKGKQAANLSSASNELLDITETAKRVSDATGGEVPAYTPRISDSPDARPLWKRAVAIYDSLSGKGADMKRRATRGINLALYKQMREAAERGELPMGADGRIDWDSIASSTDDEQVISLINNMRNDLVQVTKEKLTRKGIDTSADTLKRAVQYEDAVKEYSEASGATVNKSYDDLFELLDAANELGDLGNARPVEFNLKKLGGVLDEVSGIEVVDADGKLRQWGMDDLDPRLQGILKQMKDLSSNQSKYLKEVVDYKPPPGTEVLGMKVGRRVEERFRGARRVGEDLKKIRSQLYDLSKPNPQTGTHDITSRLASKLYGAFSDALKAPSGGTDEFQRQWASQWSKANKLHTDRMQVLDYFEAGKLLDKVLGAPEKSLNSLYGDIAAKSGSANTLISTLQKKLTKEQFDNIKSGYVDHLMNNPESLYKRQWTEAERRLLPSDVRELLQVHGARMRRVNKTDLVKAMEVTEEGGERVKRLMLNTKPERLKATLEAAGISPHVYQASLFSDILSKVTDEVKGEFVVNPQSLKNVVRDLKSSKKADLFDLLTPAQRRLLLDSDRLASFISKGDGIAVGLESMKIASKLTSFNPAKMAAGATAYGRYWLLGNMAANPAVIRMLTSLGEAPTTHAKTRAFTLGTSLLIQDINRASSDVPNGREVRK